jgi:hypothetical protein
MANHTAAQAGMAGERKALVCLFLSGGCDTFNLLVPRDPAKYAEHAAARSALVLPLNDPSPSKNLIPLNFEDAGRQDGLHPSCSRLAEMFNGTGVFAGKKRVSFLANVGTLIEGDDDIGRGGRLLPRLSADEYFCELLRWFGVSSGDMEMARPNIGEFYSPGSVANPVGFML